MIGKIPIDLHRSQPKAQNLISDNHFPVPSNETGFVLAAAAALLTTLQRKLSTNCPKTLHELNKCNSFCLCVQTAEVVFFIRGTLSEPESETNTFVADVYRCRRLKLEACSIDTKESIAFLMRFPLVSVKRSI